MSRLEYQEMYANNSDDQNSKYEPVLKFSYTNPHKVIKPVSSKAVTRWSPAENRSYVENNFQESKYVAHSVPVSSPKYENTPELIGDDSTYESIEYVDGVYKMKAAEPLVISTRTPHRAVAKNTFVHTAHNKQIMFSEMTYEERQEERRRLELGEEKGFPVYDYFARSEALKKDALSPTETHTRNNYSKWLLNEINKSRNLNKFGEVRHKAAVASAFRETQARAVTPTPPAGHDKRFKTAYHIGGCELQRTSAPRNFAVEDCDTNGACDMKGDETTDLMSGSDSRSDSPFEFNTRRARFENPECATSEEMRSCSSRTDQSESFYLNLNTVKEECSYVNSSRRKWNSSPATHQQDTLPQKQEHHRGSSPFVEGCSSTRYVSAEDYSVSREYRIDERQGYIEKISDNADGNIYDYPQVPPRPVEVRFSFQPETASKFIKTSDTLPLKASQQNDQAHTKNIQATDSQRDHHLQFGQKRAPFTAANLPQTQNPSIAHSGVNDYSYTKKGEHSSTANQRSFTHTQPWSHEDSKNKTSSTSQEKFGTSYQAGTAGKSPVRNLQSTGRTCNSPRYEGSIKSQYTSTSQNIHVTNGGQMNESAKFTVTNRETSNSPLVAPTSPRRSRKDLFNEIRLEREENLEHDNRDKSSHIVRNQSSDKSSKRNKKYEKKVSDMVRLFEELAEQQFANDQNVFNGRYQKYGYDRTKTGSLNDVRTFSTVHNTSLYEKELRTSASLSVSCTQLNRSQGVDYNKSDARHVSGAASGSWTPQNRATGVTSSTETIGQGTYKLLHDEKMSSNLSLNSKTEKIAKKTCLASAGITKSNVSRELISDNGCSERRRGSGKTVGFKEDPPFFSTKSISSSQTPQYFDSPAEKEKFSQVKKNDYYESSSLKTSLKSASSLHYSDDPKISAFEKYESWKTNSEINGRGLINDRFSQQQSRSSAALQVSLTKPWGTAISSERNTSSGNREISAANNNNWSEGSGENYYVSSTVTMTRRHPEKSPTDFSNASAMSSTFTDRYATSSERSKLHTSSNTSLANSRSSFSPAPKPSKHIQRTVGSSAPSQQMVARLHSPVRESIFHREISRSPSKFTSETECQFGSPNEMAPIHAQGTSFLSSRALASEKVRPRSQSADPEQSRRKSSRVYGLEAFRVMSPGPAPHFVRMTDEARRRSEDYHVNSDQKLLNIFFDRLIEQHKYSSTSNLQAKRAIVEQSRFIKDGPKLRKETTSSDNYSHSQQITTLNNHEHSRKQAEASQPFSSQRTAHIAGTSGYTQRIFGAALQTPSPAVGGSGFNSPSPQKMISGQPSNSDITVRTHDQKGMTNLSRFQSGMYSDDKTTISSTDSASHQNSASRQSVQSDGPEQSDEAKVVGRFQVLMGSNESTGRTASPASVFANEKPSRYLEDMNQISRKIQSKTHPDARAYLTSHFQASNSDFSSAVRTYSDNVGMMPPERTSESHRPPDHTEVASSEYSTQEKAYSRDTSKVKCDIEVPYTHEFSNSHVGRRIQKEYFHSQELSSSSPRSGRSALQGRERLLSPVAYGRSSRGYSSPLTVPSRGLSPASSLFTDDRTWSPRVLSPSQFNSVVNIQTLERNTASPVAHNDGQKDSNVLRFMVNSYDGASDIAARKQMYFRSLDADCAPLTGRMQSPSQRPVTRVD